MKKIISLTSIPSRFLDIDFKNTLISLVQQGSDEVRLYIPYAYRRFPDWDGTLPEVPFGVTICRCDEDLGPATKILPACRDLRAEQAQILFCDDDCLCERGWAKRLFKVQGKRANQAVATYVRSAEGYVSNRVYSKQRPLAWQLPILFDIPYRVSRLFNKMFGTKVLKRRPFVLPGYGDIFFGAGGVVVRPHFFDDVAFDIPPEAWLVDDVWLSANLARVGISIFCPWMGALPKPTRMCDKNALLDVRFLGHDRQGLNSLAAKTCQIKFGIWS